MDCMLFASVIKSIFDKTAIHFIVFCQSINNENRFTIKYVLGPETTPKSPLEGKIVCSKL